jgi:hypothetical protein
MSLGDSLMAAHRRKTLCTVRMLAALSIRIGENSLAPDKKSATCHFWRFLVCISRNIDSIERKFGSTFCGGNKNCSQGVSSRNVPIGIGG